MENPGKTALSACCSLVLLLLSAGTACHDSSLPEHSCLVELAVKRLALYHSCSMRADGSNCTSARRLGLLVYPIRHMLCPAKRPNVLLRFNAVQKFNMVQSGFAGSRPMPLLSSGLPSVPASC